MLEKDDWRLGNLPKYLLKANLLHMTYISWSDTWDHDHCKFCYKTINDPNKYYYCTEDEYYWICEECYEDFKEMFQWTIVEGEPIDPPDDDPSEDEGLPVGEGSVPEGESL